VEIASPPSAIRNDRASGDFAAAVAEVSDDLTVLLKTDIILFIG
jgi:hypothetical protein